MGANDRIQATRGKDYIFVYTAQGKPITVNLGKISGKDATAFWYNPKNGETKDDSRFQNAGQKVFTPPTSGYGHDWILVIDDVARNYDKPKAK